MKQAQRQSAVQPSAPAKRSSAKAASHTTAAHKPWSVKLEVRLPHKIGQPLGSSSSDGGD